MNRFINYTPWILNLIAGALIGAFVASFLALYIFNITRESQAHQMVTVVGILLGTALAYAWKRREAG